MSAAGDPVRLPSLLFSLLSVLVPLLCAPGRGAEMHEGWPKIPGFPVNTSPALWDLNNDGKEEVIFGCFDGDVYAIDGQSGSCLTGWPVKTGSWVHSSPAVGDVDRDGDLEVVVVSWDSHIYLIHHDGKINSPWPVPFPASAVEGWRGKNTPTLADLDQDGQLEILYVDTECLLVLRHDGTFMQGWDEEVSRARGKPRGGSASVGDLDGNGSLEIVVFLDGDLLAAFHPDGGLFQSWKVSSPPLQEGIGEDLYLAPLLGDLDADGLLDILAATTHGSVWAWSAAGKLLPGEWPRETGESFQNSPALGDLDGDGKLEVVAATAEGTLHIWRHDGSPLPGWPKKIHAKKPSGFLSSPVLGDVDGDGSFEIIAGSQDSSVYVWKGDGSFASGWPAFIQGPTRSTPSLGDVDGDGKLEIAVGQENDRVFLWDASGACHPGRIPWGTLYHDGRRTGRCGPDLFEPDDSPNSAAFFLAGSAQVHNLHSATDEDWFVFSASQEDELSFEVQSLSPNPPSVSLTLFEGSPLSPLATASMTNGMIHLPWKVLKTGNTFLCVRTKEGVLGEFPAHYRFAVQGRFPPVPTGFRCEKAEDGSLFLSWSASFGKGVDGYVLSAWEEGKGTFRKETVRDTSCMLDGLQNGKRYLLSLQAHDFEGNLSGFSSPISLIPRDAAPAVPSEPCLLMLEDSSLKLIWRPNKEKDLKEYRILARDASSGKLLSSWTAQDSCFNPTNLDSENEYSFSILARDRTGNESKESKPVCGKPHGYYLDNPLSFLLVPGKGRGTGFLVELLYLSVLGLFFVLLLKGTRFGRSVGERHRVIHTLFFIGIVGILMNLVLGRFFTERELQTGFSFAWFLSSALELLLTSNFILILAQVTHFLFKAPGRFNRAASFLFTALMVGFLTLLVYQKRVQHLQHLDILEKKDLIQELLIDKSLRTLLKAKEIAGLEEIRTKIRAHDNVGLKNALKTFFDSGKANPRNTCITVLDRAKRDFVQMGLNAPPLSIPEPVGEEDQIVFQKWGNELLGFLALAAVTGREGVAGWIAVRTHLDEPFLLFCSEWAACYPEIWRGKRLLASSMGGASPEESGESLLGSLPKVFMVDPQGQGYSVDFRLKNHFGENLGSLYLLRPYWEAPFPGLSKGKTVLVLTLLLLIMAGTLRSFSEREMREFLFHPKTKLFGVIFLGLAVMNLPLFSVLNSERGGWVAGKAYAVSNHFTVLTLFILFVFWIVFAWMKRPVRAKLIFSYLMVSIFPILILLFFFFRSTREHLVEIIDEGLKEVETMAEVHPHVLLAELRYWFHLRELKEDPEQQWKPLEMWITGQRTHLNKRFPNAFTVIRLERVEALPAIMESDFPAPEEFVYSLAPFPKWLKKREGFCGITLERGEIFIKSVRCHSLPNTKDYLAIETYIPLDEHVLLPLEERLNKTLPIPCIRLEGPLRQQSAGSAIFGAGIISLASHALKVFQWQNKEEISYFLVVSLAVRSQETLGALLLLLLLLLLPFLLSGVGGLLTYRGLIFRVDKLLKGTERIKRGDLQHKILLRGKDEFKVVADSFNDMAEEINKQIRDLTLLNKAGAAMLAVGDLPSFLRTALEKTLLLLETDQGLLLLSKRGSSRFRTAAFQGLPEEEVHSLEIAAPDEPSRWKDEWCRVQSLEDLLREGAPGEGFIGMERLLSLGFLLFSPLVGKEQVLGILLLGGRRSGQPYTLEDLQVLTTASSQIAMALDNIRKYEELRDAHEKITTQQKRLLHAEKLAALGEFSAGVAHEIRNPLGIIQVSAGAIQSSLSRDDPNFELITLIQNETNRLNTVLNQILSYAKPTSPNRLLVQPAQIWQDSRKAVLELLAGKGIRLDACTEENLPPILVDQAQIYQVLLNLIGNAVEAMPKGGVLSIRVAFALLPPRLEGDLENLEDKGRGAVMMEIKDTGAGIPEGNLKTIFTPFFTTKKKGTGLGLAIVKQLVLHNGGRILVESEEGRGTVFRIYFPGEDAPEGGS